MTGMFKAMAGMMNGKGCKGGKGSGFGYEPKGGKGAWSGGKSAWSGGKGRAHPYGGGKGARKGKGKTSFNLYPSPIPPKGWQATFDWQSTACKCVNFVARTKCFQCSAPKST